MPEIHIPPPTPDDIAAISHNLERVHMDGLHASDGRSYAEVMIDNLRRQWDATKELSQPDIVLLWDCISQLREEINTFREMDLEGREEYD